MEHTHLNKLDPNKYFEKYISNINLKKDFKGKKCAENHLISCAFCFSKIYQLFDLKPKNGH